MPQLSLKPAKSGVRLQPATTRGLRLANVRNETFDTKTRTFTFVLASETPVRTWRIDEAWNYVEVDEILPMSGLRGLDTFRGCPLLDTHSSWSVRDVLGRITPLRVEGSELVGDAFLSDREDVVGVARDLELAEWIDANGMSHVRGAPLHPQARGKIERWHQTLKNRILLENYFLPGDLEQQIDSFVEHDNHRRYHESIGNLTPADVYFGRGDIIMLERERIKRETTRQRRLLHREAAA